MVLLTFAGATSVLAQLSDSPAALPILQPQPLLSEQRLARAEYWLSRRGLQFGVPLGAYDTAVTEMRVMEARQAGAQGLPSSPESGELNPSPKPSQP